MGAIRAVWQLYLIGLWVGIFVSISYAIFSNVLFGDNPTVVERIKHLLIRVFLSLVWPLALLSGPGRKAFFHSLSETQ